MAWFSFKKQETPSPPLTSTQRFAQESIPIVVNQEFVSKLKPYVAPPGLLPPAIAEGAPEILPGIVFAVAVDMGTQVNLIPVSTMVEIAPADMPERERRGPKLVRQAAIENLQKLPLPPVHVTRVLERADSDVLLLEQQDSFVASRITFLSNLLDRVAERKPRTHGVLAAIPRRRTLLLHIPSGLGVLKAMEVMAVTARGLFESSTQSRLSPNVYYLAPDGTSEIVAFPDTSTGVVIQTAGKLGKALYGPEGLLPKGLEQEGHKSSS
jgi:hypothetical protein